MGVFQWSDFGPLVFQIIKDVSLHHPCMYHQSTWCGMSMILKFWYLIKIICISCGVLLSWNSFIFSYIWFHSHDLKAYTRKQSPIYLVPIITVAALITIRFREDIVRYRPTVRQLGALFDNISLRTLVSHVYAPIKNALVSLSVCKRSMVCIKCVTWLVRKLCPLYPGQCLSLYRFIFHIQPHQIVQRLSNRGDYVWSDESYCLRGAWPDGGCQCQRSTCPTTTCYYILYCYYCYYILQTLMMVQPLLGEIELVSHISTHVKLLLYLETWIQIIDICQVRCWRLAVSWSTNACM